MRTIEEMQAHAAKMRETVKKKREQKKAAVKGDAPKPEDNTLAGPPIKPPLLKAREPDTPPREDLFEDAPEGLEEDAVEELSVFPSPAPLKDEVLPMRPDDGIPPLDTGLSPDEKKQFIEMINKEMPPLERAKTLCTLARMKGTKTAAVGLRAVQEILSLTGMKDNAATESAPLFVLPSNTAVAIMTQKVEK